MKTAIAAATHRHAVQTVRYRGKVVPEAALMSVFAFLATYLLMIAFAAAVVASSGADLITSLSAGITAVGNVGPGLGAVGPTDGFGRFPDYVKGTLCFAMIAGRLEIFTFLVVFTPGFWRR